MKGRYTKKDLVTLDFIQNEIERLSNCDDASAMYDIEGWKEYQENCDRARELLHDFMIVINRSLTKNK